MNNTNAEEEIDLLKLLNALWKKAWLIALAAIAGAVIAMVVTLFFITPTYESTAMMYVNNSGDTSDTNKINSSDLSAAQSLVDTYAVILNSRVTLEQVIAQANLPYDYEELGNMIEAAAVDGTEIFSITVTSTDPEEAAMIANTIVDVLPNRISEIVTGSDVRTVSAAVVPTEKSSPSNTKNTLIGFALGFILACAVIIVRDIMDTQIHAEDYLLTEYPDIPLLSVIPDMSKKDDKNHYYYYGSN